MGTPRAAIRTASSQTWSCTHSSEPWATNREATNRGASVARGGCTAGTRGDESAGVGLRNGRLTPHRRIAVRLEHYQLDAHVTFIARRRGDSSLRGPSHLGGQSESSETPETRRRQVVWWRKHVCG